MDKPKVVVPASFTWSDPFAVKFPEPSSSVFLYVVTLPPPGFSANCVLTPEAFTPCTKGIALLPTPIRTEGTVYAYVGKSPVAATQPEAVKSPLPSSSVLFGVCTLEPESISSVKVEPFEYA